MGGFKYSLKVNADYRIKLDPFDGFIASIFATETGGFDCVAFATRTSTSEWHSLMPVASSSRNDLLRDMDHNMPAATDTGPALSNDFSDG